MIALRTILRSSDPAHLVFFALSAGLCLVAALTMQVNPFPVDGWFHSQYKLFARSANGENYSPTAAPALVFWTARKIVEGFFGGNLQQQMYVSMLLQVGLVWLGGVCIYLSGHLLGARWPSVVASLGVLLTMFSTWMAHAFWSEATVFSLAAVTAYLLVRTHTGIRQGNRNILLWTVLVGVSTGLLTITRIVPVVALCGFILILLGSGERRVAVRHASIAIAITAAIVIAQAWANQARFGRFELTSSADLHFYNSYHRISGEVLAGLEAYQTLRTRVPDTAGQPHWVLLHKIVLAGIPYNEGMRMVREFNHHALTREPWKLLSYGIQKTRLFLAMSPEQYGRYPQEGAKQQITPDRNPLGRDRYLPALLDTVGWFPEFMNLVNRAVDRYYQYFFAALAASIAWLYTWSSVTRIQSMAMRHLKPVALIGLWPLLYVAVLGLLTPATPSKLVPSMVAAGLLLAPAGYRAWAAARRGRGAVSCPSPLAALAVVYLLSALALSLLSLPLGRFQVPLLPWLAIMTAIVCHQLLAPLPPDRAAPGHRAG